MKNTQNKPMSAVTDLHPYPQYIDSGLPWLGPIPITWKIMRAKSVFRPIDERSTTGKEELLTVSSARGIVPRKSVNVTMFKAESYSGYKLCWPGDLVINSLWSWAGGLGVSRHHGIVSSAYGVYRIRDGAPMIPEFVHELVRSSSFNWELRVRSKGIWISRLQLTDMSFLDTPILLPPPSEQAAIVRFLTWANGRIDRAIRAKRTIIALLNEQKQAIIRRAVTRGIDDSVPLKTSGSSWISEIPKHWEVRRIKTMCSILRGKFTHRPRNDPSLYDGPYPFIQTGSVARANKFITSYSQTLNEKGLAVSKLFPSGTLAMTIAANIGDVAILTFDACFPDSVVGLVPSDELERDYLFLVLRCMKQEFLNEAPVNTQGNLNVERIGAMRIPVPPKTEQKRIAESIQAQIAEPDIAISRFEREIELLSEYRTRLVADVVTGKLNVVAASCGLPDEELQPNMPGSDSDMTFDPESLDEEECLL